MSTVYNKHISSPALFDAHTPAAAFAPSTAQQHRTVVEAPGEKPGGSGGGGDYGGGDDDTFEIVIHTSVSSLPLRVAPADTVEILKSKIHLALNVRPEQQCLMFADKKLEVGARTLYEYKLKKNSWIVLLFVTARRGNNSSRGRNAAAAAAGGGAAAAAYYEEEGPADDVAAGEVTSEKGAGAVAVVVAEGVRRGYTAGKQSEDEGMMMIKAEAEHEPKVEEGAGDDDDGEEEEGEGDEEAHHSGSQRWIATVKSQVGPRYELSAVDPWIPLP